jgi:hypothetical protein
MCDWLLFATRWRSDGTPRPDRKLLNAVANGDPLAVAFLAAAILCVAGPALYKFLGK